MFSGQSDGPKEMVVLFHRWWGAAFGVPGFIERTSRRRFYVPPRDELRTAAVHDVQLLAALVTTGLRVVLVEETLEVFVWGLIPQLPLRRGSGIGGLLLAGPSREEEPSMEAWSRLLLRRSASF
jgi:hypothetical protein